ncbi:MAG: DUF3943 domain-containing protein [Proteobacteria bacterium]|nr:MAG: DUF3943 domain-containing protein [Pseudomonadota bacterium]
MTWVRFSFCLIVGFYCLQSTSLSAQEKSAAADSYVQVSREDISAGEKAANFGFIYLVQWTGYYVSQESVVRDHGSLKNMRENITKPHFDKDHFNWNLSKHTLTGQYYYLFYRSRGYGKQSAFHWSAISSLAFEFAIETATERPSYQDIYQTPVFGSILGMGTERLSLYLHSLQTVPTTLLGYLLNPFTILPAPYSAYQIAWAPMQNGKNKALALTVGVEL